MKYKIGKMTVYVIANIKAPLPDYLLRALEARCGCRIDVIKVDLFTEAPGAAEWESVNRDMPE